MSDSFKRGMRRRRNQSLLAKKKFARLIKGLPREEIVELRNAFELMVEKRDGRAG
jgi:hypothetical protein